MLAFRESMPRCRSRSRKTLPASTWLISTRARDARPTYRCHRASTPPQGRAKRNTKLSRESTENTRSAENTEDTGSTEIGNPLGIHKGETRKTRKTWKIRKSGKIVWRFARPSPDGPADSGAAGADSGAAGADSGAMLMVKLQNAG
eukprot:gene14611-biopygen1060